MELSDHNRDEWIERYLRGELTPEEQIEFETRFIRDPQLMDDVEVAAAFRLKEAYRGQSVPAAPRRNWWTPMLVAASVLALAVLVLVRQADIPVAHGNVQIVTLGMYRGGGDGAVPLAVGSAERVVFEVPVAGGGDHYFLRWIAHPGGKTLKIENLRDGGEGYLTFGVDRRFLAPGLHRFEVSSDRTVQEFSLQVE